ncbi:MAG: hypothetical protein HYV97_04090 [Bdellovibrio sp.]|nr:hypothetical protein [Bdellovibrio sp.]
MRIRSITLTLLPFLLFMGFLSAHAEDDYRLNWFPAEKSEWEQVVSLVERYQSAIPKSVRSKIERASINDLLYGVSNSYTQDIQTEPGKPSKTAAIELTRILIPISFERFSATFPAAEWGVRLDHYLGGEVVVYERDAKGRPIRQLERMVLSLLPGDLDIWSKNQDMTKLEVIRYGERRATVTWWVRYSDNRSTESDLGTVDFQASAEGTLVTFHSAHRIRALGGPLLPAFLVKPVLESFFLDHLRHYRDQVWSN